MTRHAFFENLAAQDDPLAFGPEHEPRLARLRRRLGDLQGKRVLEPGCGAGPLTGRLADWVGPSGRVLAFDACPGMVEKCRKNLADCAWVRVAQGQAEEMDLEPGTWDVILCFRLYPHLEQPRAFLRQCAAGLAPGGELVIANLEGSAVVNAIHATLTGVQGDYMPPGATLVVLLTELGWRVDEAIDEPEEFFLRARPG